MATREPVIDLQVVLGEPPDARDIELTYFPVDDEDGELLGVGGIIRDVTEREAAESDRLELTRNALEMRARAETAQVRAEPAAAEAAREPRRPRRPGGAPSSWPRPAPAWPRRATCRSRSISWSAPPSLRSPTGAW